ncbi:unnamed protein product, partial [Meganyctiphanes norvegica]
SIAGLLIAVPLLTGIIICIKNKRNNTLYTIDQYIIGHSAFYKDLVNNHQGDIADDPSSVECHKLNTNYTEDDKSAPLKTDAIRFLADTVVEERNRASRQSLAVFGSGMIYKDENPGSPVSGPKNSEVKFMNSRIMVPAGEFNNADGVLECLGLPNQLQPCARTRSQ